MRVLEYVPGEVLVLEVASRSRPGRVRHYLSVAYDEDGDVRDVACTCEAATFRTRCHHVVSVMDLVGVTP
jgi:hypothetical protein